MLGCGLRRSFFSITYFASARSFGSLWTDEVDPFAVAGAVPSVSCRLYRDPDGRTEGAPSVQALRRALVGVNVDLSFMGEQR